MTGTRLLGKLTLYYVAIGLIVFVTVRLIPGDVIDLTWVDRSGQQRSGKATLGS